MNEFSLERLHVVFPSDWPSTPTDLAVPVIDRVRLCDMVPCSTELVDVDISWDMFDMLNHVSTWPSIREDHQALLERCAWIDIFDHMLLNATGPACFNKNLFQVQMRKH